jgi:hypothetical protein
MKEQYVGDVNDYRKYALLRLLATEGKVRVGICWMLTPADGRSDGGKTAYLDQPSRWSQYDPDLFKQLKGVRDDTGVQRLKLIERSGLMRKALFFNEHISDRTDLRGAFFDATWSHLKRAELIFFDPDNGLEVSSKPKGSSGSSKFIYYDEVAAACARGHSVLVYQHFPHQKRDQFVRAVATKLTSIAAGARLWCFRTGQIAFLLLIHPNHEARLAPVAKSIPEHWRPQFIDGKQLLQVDG